MGLFGGSDDGLYRGDAPVSVPGTGSAGPQPYDTAAASARISEWSGIGAASDAERGLRQSRQRSRQTAEAQAQARHSPMRRAGSANAPTGVVSSKKASSAGTWIGFAVILALVAFGALVARGGWWSDDPAGVSADSVPGADALAAVPEAVDEVAPPADAGGSDVSDSDDGLVFDYDGAQLQVVVWIGALHEHGTWATAAPAMTPSIVVEVDVTRVDGGADPVALDAWNWRLDSPGGPGVWPIAATGVSPSLVDATLAGGDTVSGYLTFPVGGPVVTLVFTEGAAGDDLATWDFIALSPEVIDAAFDDAIRPEVGQPPFSVEVTSAQSTDDTDSRFAWPSQSGRYLTFALQIEVDDDLADFAGYLSTDNFVFVTDDGQELEPVYGVTDDDLRQIVLDHGGLTTATLSFDTAATAGVLELRDGAGTLAVRWPAGDS